MAASTNFPKLPSDWSEKTHSLKTECGEVFTRMWHKNNFGEGRLLFIVHGQGEQSGRYEHFPFYLHTSIDAVAVIDLPGHGKSSGIRGHCESFDDYSSTVLAAFNYWTEVVKKEKGKVTAHWFGHSLGGLITIRTLFKEPNLDLKSVSVSAPLLGLALPVPKLKKFFGVLLEPLIGRLPLENEINASHVSHDLDVVEQYKRDPLNHSKVTSRFFVQMTKEMEAVAKPKSEFPYSLLMLIPLADYLVSWKSSYEFYSHLNLKTGMKKELSSFPDFYHESFNEIGKGRAFLALEDWLNKNSK